MNKRSKSALLVAVPWILVVADGARAGNGVDFRFLGDVLESGSRVRCISADGTRLGGELTAPWADQAAFWDRLGAPESATTYTFNRPSHMNAITADGSIGVGSNAYDPIVQAYGPFQWTRSTHTAAALPRQIAPWESDAAFGVSANGGVIVGQVNGQAVMWSGGGLPVALVPAGPYDDRASAVSADGARVVGTRSWNRDERQAFMWTSVTGAVNLPSLPGGSTASTALAVSADGLTIVGYARASDLLGDYLTRWVVDPVTGTASATQLASQSQIEFEYGLPEAAAVSGDGRVIGGSVNGRAVIWTEATGLVRIEDLLTQANPDWNVNGWALFDVTGISADGLTIVGNAIEDPSNGNFRQHGWVLTIPSPSAAEVLVVALGLQAARRRRY